MVRATGQGRSALRPGAPASPSRGEKRGSVAGAVALIVGTSIGSGILAVPQRTAPAVSLSSLAPARLASATMHGPGGTSLAWKKTAGIRFFE